MTNRKVLLVDDDPNILQGLRRHLRKSFQIETAPGGQEGLEAVAQKGPFAVVVSDMQMPRMNGVEFLGAVKKVAPNSVRMMLTGNADQKTAQDAVNDGHIFRFLTKPCDNEEFARALESGIEHHRLLTIERELLSSTLSGSVGVLTEVLSLVNPTAFGHSAHVRQLTRKFCEQLDVENAWEIEIGAMLSQVGCVVIPETTLARLAAGERLSDRELEMYRQHPKVGEKLISKIPRLGGVAKIIAYQQKHYDGTGMPEDEVQGDQIPLGARVIKLATDVVQLQLADYENEEIWSVISGRTGWYDPELLGALVGVLDVEYVVQALRVMQLEDDMILDEHMVTLSGDVLLSRGHRVTPLLRERLATFASSDRGVREPIRVRCPVARLKSTEEEAPKVSASTA